MYILGCVGTHVIGDGYCDDFTNSEVCNYDGGDCCGEDILTDYCNECQCLEGDNEAGNIREQYSIVTVIKN